MVIGDLGQRNLVIWPCWGVCTPPFIGVSQSKLLQYSAVIKVINKSVRPLAYILALFCFKIHVTGGCRVTLDFGAYSLIACHP